MKRIALTIALCAALSACGPATVQSTGTVAASPVPATTLAEAEQFATLVTRTTGTYVTTANPSAAQLRQIKALSDAVHAALTSLEKANANGQPLVFSAFNAALQAFNAYRVN